MAAQPPAFNEACRLAALIAAEARVPALLDHIEAQGVITTGRSESTVEHIFAPSPRTSSASPGTGTSASSAQVSTR